MPQYDEYDWRSDALCKGKHIDLWYPPLDTDVPENYYTISRAVCKQCPVWGECLDDGASERWGLWGGLTPQERTALVVANPKASTLRAHGTWIRFRQGCRCTECTDAHSSLNDKINIEEIPNMTDDLTDLEMLKFRLIQP